MILSRLPPKCSVLLLNVLFRCCTACPGKPCLLCRCSLLILQRLCFSELGGEAKEGCQDKLATNLSFRLLHLFDFPCRQEQCVQLDWAQQWLSLAFGGGPGSSAWESCFALLSLAHLPPGLPLWGRYCRQFVLGGVGTPWALHNDPGHRCTLSLSTPLFWFSSYTSGQMLLLKENSRECGSGTEPLPSSSLKKQNWKDAPGSFGFSNRS